MWGCGGVGKGFNSGCVDAGIGSGGASSRNVSSRSVSSRSVSSRSVSSRSVSSKGVSSNGVSRRRLPQLAFLVGFCLMFGKDKGNIGSRGVFNRWHFL